MRLDFVAPIIPPTVVDLTPCGFILTLSLSNKRQAGECDVEEKTFKPVQSASVTCHADRARSPLAMSLQTTDAVISRSIPVNASGRQRGHLKSGPAAVVQGGARPSYRFTSIWVGADAADLFFGASSGLRFSPGPSRTPSQDRSKSLTRSNSESPWHGGIFEAFLEFSRTTKICIMSTGRFEN